MSACQRCFFKNTGFFLAAVLYYIVVRLDRLIHGKRRECERPLGNDFILLLRMKALKRKRLFKNADGIALYGAGAHSERLLNLNVIEKNMIKSVFDDRHATSDFHGIPLLAPSDVSKFDFDLLLVSSDAYEKQMAERATGWLPAGKLLGTIYENRIIRIK